MATPPTWTPVVALALSDTSGRLLLQQRPLGKHHEGMWEFPGGKVELSENPRNALAREIYEELGIVLDPAALAPALVADDGLAQGIVLILYTATHWIGEPDGREGQKWGWFARDDAAALPLAPMDRDLFARLPL